MKLRILCAACSLIVASSAVAVDGVSFEAGHGNGVDMARLGLQWNWDRQWFKGDNWLVSGYWDVSLGLWNSNALPGQNGSVAELGITPTFSLRQTSGRGLFAEAGVGPHVLSKTSIDSRNLGSALQFGSHLGAGYRFGEKHAFELGLRYQHLSNAGIKQPNDGVNFSQVRAKYQF